MIEDWTFADDFLRFFEMSVEKRTTRFLKSEKNLKYVFSNTAHHVKI